MGSPPFPLNPRLLAHEAFVAYAVEAVPGRAWPVIVAAVCAIAEGWLADVDAEERAAVLAAVRVEVLVILESG